MPTCISRTFSSPTWLRGQQTHRSRFEIGRNDCFDKQAGLAQRFRRFDIHRSVESEHRTEGAQRVARQGVLAGLREIRMDSGTTRVVVLHHRCGRLIESADDIQCRIQVKQIVVRQFLPAELSRRDEIRRSNGWVGIQCGPLMRILAVPQLRFAPERKVSAGRKLSADRIATHVVGDRSIVRRGMIERITGQLGTQRHRCPTGGIELSKNLAVLLGAGGDRDIAMILRRGTHKTRSADIDLLHAVGPARSHSSSRRGEGVQVDDDQIKRNHPVFFDRIHVIITVADRQNAAKDFRMQRLHPPIHHLRKSGVLRDVTDIDARLLQVSPRATGAVDRHTGSLQSGAQIGQPKFVADTDQSVTNGNNVSHGGSLG